ncbi:hypothetical protein JTE90_001556 [Oedothorax gibbosus]|uniref:receptor protein-tyrosine kinase n=1 Tax=Oedothorax gibbosus TaxID=931172 RepID=A0AAV6VLL8_9ARAC|nr:hypothetical protein JTE90_001556 [Oedothorax gibbosus]
MFLLKQIILIISVHSTLQLFSSGSNIPSLLDTLKSFTFPPEQKLSNLAVDRTSGDVFVTSDEFLYHFSEDLEDLGTVRTWPIEDEDVCSVLPEDCNTSTANVNDILKVVDFLVSPPKLLLCGSAFNRSCQIRPTNNLSTVKWIHPYNSSLGFNLGWESNQALFDRGYNGQWTLFTVHSHNEEDSKTIPFISKKVLMKDNDEYFFHYPLEDYLNSSYLYNDRSEKRMLRNEGFIHDGFVYFVYEHYWISTSVSTNIIRFCPGDSTLRSYNDILIRCRYRSEFIMEPLRAFYGDGPGPGEKSLFVSYNVTGGTILCVFPMSKLVETFERVPTESEVGWLGGKCLMNDTKDESSVCGFNGIVKQCRHFDVQATMLLPNVTMKTLSTVRQGNETIAIGLLTDGSVIKVGLSTKKIFARNTLAEDEYYINPPYSFAFDRDYKHIFFLFQRKIVKYPVESCSVHETCTKCLSLGQIDPLQCGWCEGRCTRLQECPNSDLFIRDECNPIIYEVMPNYTTVQSGTRLAIIGDSFGDYMDEKRNSISVANIPSEVLQWHNDLVVFKGPRIFGIYPDEGPFSGGTNVTIFGENLDYDRHMERIFIVNRRVCTLLILKKNAASCTTGNKSLSQYPDTIALSFNNMVLLIEENLPSYFNTTGLSQYFEYTRDPTIHQIRPGATTMSGLKNLTATGVFLNVVQFPKLVVKVSIMNTSKYLDFIEECWTDPDSRGTFMTCRTPSLIGRPKVPVPTWSQPLMTYVSFIMDGVHQLRYFYIYQEIARFMYYPDPDFEDVWLEEDKRVIIKGNHFNLINSEDNFQILLNEVSCEIKAITMEYISCDIPPAFKFNNISVEVIIGYSKHYLGNLRPQEPVNAEATLNPLWWIAIGLFCVFGTIAVFICLKYWKTKFVRHFEGINVNDKLKNVNEYHVMRTNPSVNVAPADAILQENQNNELHHVDQEIMTLLENKRLIILKQRLVIGEKVGEGQFGCVFEGALKLLEETEAVKVAIKTLHEHTWSNPKTVESFLCEALVMKDFDHPNVLSLLGVCFEEVSGPSIVLPFMENGDLCSFIRDKTKVLQVSHLLKFALEIASGMAYLVNQKFVHRDLAARNCILDSTLCAKVADFGLSRDVYVDDYYCCNDRTAKLPYRWMALESIERQVYSTKTDVWSYGVLLWELMTRGSLPYAHVGNWDLLEYIKLGNRLDKPQFCPQALYMVMLACWNKESKNRPDFTVLQECISIVRQHIIEKLQGRASSKSVPAKNNVYYNSKELYLHLENYVLDKKLLENTYFDADEYLNMNKESTV